MNYTNEIIRDITDVANPKSKRTLAIADSEKSAVALTTLAITAEQMGLAVQLVDGVGESGKANQFLVVASTKGGALEWAIELALVGDGYKAGTRTRRRLQQTMGHALGYDNANILEFILSEVAATCPCTCCGGDPE
jgi:hypothetical protein